MPQSINFTGTLRMNPTDTAPPATVPVSFATTFTQKSEQDLSFSTAVTNRLIDKGSISAPRCVYIEVTSGTVSFSQTNDNANPIRLSMEDTPTPTDKAALLLFTHNPAAFSLYMTTLGPVACRVWFFS
jgi:hypothetical protein